MDEQERTTTIENEVVKSTDLNLGNQDIKLENLPRYEDLITPNAYSETTVNKDVSDLPFFQERPKVDKVDPKAKVRKARIKIAVGVFSVIGVLLFALVLINGVNLVVLNNEIKDNGQDIASLTQEVEMLSNQDFALDGLDGETKNVGYKLALPRNYPNSTADLTWFDKISIFLMKLFG